MNKGMLCLVIFCVLLSGMVIYINYRRTKKTMDRLEAMLELAMEDEFSEKTFDESRLSALETKFAHYFSASAISARNVKVEKDKIKTLISDISHQTKTPISNILLYSELLAEENLTETASANVEALHQQTEKLRFLIQSLVKLSRLENGILALKPRQGEIQPVPEEVFEQYEEKAKSKGLKLRLKESAACASFDAKWTAEALGNLVDNAIKYTDCGEVVLSAVSYELFVRIDVKDTGIGILEQEQAKIFSRFYRSEQAGNREGVGIGLFLAREIISGEGGYMKVSSVKGEGSVFSVFLPR